MLTHRLSCEAVGFLCFLRVCALHAADPLGGDGAEGVAQLGEDEGEEVQLCVAEASGEGVGKGGDPRRQGTGVHPSASRMCSSARASTAAKST